MGRVNVNEAREAWLQEHGDDPVQVRLIDLMTLLARLEQVSREPGFETVSVTHERIFTCDLPRLRDCLPAEALEILMEETRG